LIGLLLFALVVLVRLPSIQQPLDNDSGAVAYHARLITQGEPLYGSHHPNHHLPGPAYTYAAIFFLLGDASVSLKIALVFWVWLNAWVLYLIGKRLNGRLAGALVAVFFALVNSMTNLMGDTAETENFSNLPLTLCFWLGLILLQKKSRPHAYILVGALGAAAFLYKANYLAALGAIGGALFLDAILEKNLSAWIEFFQRGLAILAGVALTLSAVSAYFISHGLFERLLLVFQLGSRYIGYGDAKPVYYIFLGPITVLLTVNPILVFFGLLHAGRCLIHLRRTLSEERFKGLAQTALLLWLLGSILEAGILRTPFRHYVLLVVPPLALLASLEIALIWKRIVPSGGNKLPARAWIPITMILAVLANSLYTSQDYLGGYFQYLNGQITWTEFVQNHTFLGEERTASVETAQYLAEHTHPDETIFLWTDQAQIYYLANRRSSADIIWPFYIPSLGDPRRVLVSKPRYIVTGPLFLPVEKMPAWLGEELDNHYVLETTIKDRQLYRRVSP
jgi:4-amino-4-deoxy-L-arabinose transferase-like glycosyltransferase